MDDGYIADTKRIGEVGQAFAEQQPKPTTLAGTLEGASAVDVGDPALAAKIQSMVADLVAALNGLATGLGQDAAKLQQQALGYQRIHEETAALIRQYREANLPK